MAFRSTHKQVAPATRGVRGRQGDVCCGTASAARRGMGENGERKADSIGGVR